MPDQLLIDFSAPQINPRRHYSRVEDSEPLQRLLRLLMDGNYHSPREMNHVAGVECATAWLQALKDPRNGCYIKKLWILAGPLGKGHYEYRLEYLPPRLKEFMEGNR